MVPTQLGMESNYGKQDENGQCDDFLDDFQLHEVKRAAVLLETDTVGGHLQAVFEKSDTPTDCNHADERQLLKPFVFS